MKMPRWETIAVFLFDPGWVIFTFVTKVNFTQVCLPAGALRAFDMMPFEASGK